MGPAPRYESSRDVGFIDDAAPDLGSTALTTYVLNEVTAGDEAGIGALVTKAVR